MGLRVVKGLAVVAGRRQGRRSRSEGVGGIVVRDWEVGVRIRRRRGLKMFFTLGVVEVVGLDAGAGQVMVAVSYGCN